MLPHISSAARCSERRCGWLLRSIRPVRLLGLAQHIGDQRGQRADIFFVQAENIGPLHVQRNRRVLFQVWAATRRSGWPARLPARAGCSERITHPSGPPAVLPALSAACRAGRPVPAHHASRVRPQTLDQQLVTRQNPRRSDSAPGLPGGRGTRRHTGSLSARPGGRFPAAAR